MRVIVAVGGKWQALKLGEQLEARGHLHRIITSYPRWAFRSPSIDPEKIIHFPLAEAAGRGINWLARSDSGDYWKAVLFDRFVSTRAARCDLFFGFSSFCLATLRRKKKECPSILERACPHILDQMRTLREEAAQLGIRYAVDQRMVDRMLEEYELADGIVVPSKFSQRSFLSRGFDPGKIKIVTLCAKFPPPSNPPDKRNQPRFRLLFVGGSFLRKGLIYLLRAWDQLRLKDAELILRASDTPAVPEARMILKNPTIQVVGHQDDLGPLYSGASAFCLPSVDEGFGYVVLEAMSYGLPVIITENVGAADCVRDGTDGFVVKTRDVEALKEKILLLYEDNKKRVHMGEAARGQASRYTWDVYGDGICRILSQALCSPRNSHVDTRP